MYRLTGRLVDGGGGLIKCLYSAQKCNLTFYIAACYCLENKVDYFGNNLKELDFVPSASHCQFECQKNESCTFFTFNTENGKCFLKTNNVAVANDTAVSGPRFCISNQGKHSLKNGRKRVSSGRKLD